MTKTVVQLGREREGGLLTKQGDARQVGATFHTGRVLYELSEHGTQERNKNASPWWFFPRGVIEDVPSS